LPIQASFKGEEKPLTDKLKSVWKRKIRSCIELTRKGGMNRNGCCYVHLTVPVRSIDLSAACLYHTDIKRLENQLTRSIYLGPFSLIRSLSTWFLSVNLPYRESILITLSLNFLVS
jgi:hypothetical protein